ncbi:MAG: hypothetical protein HGA65_14495, partial [Oscillochloris sp.]|nr:hypothetical protein [Oscillochloris sp.]
LERWRIADHVSLVGQGSFEILTLVEGSCTLRWPAGDLTVRCGESIVIPASLASYNLLGQAIALRVYVPDLSLLAEQLRLAGHAEAQIATALHDPQLALPLSV